MKFYLFFCLIFRQLQEIICEPPPFCDAFGDVTLKEGQNYISIEFAENCQIRFSEKMAQNFPKLRFFNFAEKCANTCIDAPKFVENPVFKNICIKSSNISTSTQKTMVTLKPIIISTTPSNENATKKLTVGAIAGIVIGCCLSVALLIGSVLYIWKKRTSFPANSTNNYGTEMSVFNPAFIAD